MVRTNLPLKLKPASRKQMIIGSGLTFVVASISLAVTNGASIGIFLNSVICKLPWDSLSGALLIFGLRLTDVPIGTLKTVFMVRGMRPWATLLGLLEVTIWITAMGKVMGQLDNPWNIAGYALGYSVGTWLGMWLESRLAFGTVEVHAISLAHSAEVAEVIRTAG